MNGLEKIIDRILSDAKKKASVIVDEANEECRRIAAEYAERTQQKKDEILDGLKNGKLLVPHSQFNNGDNSKKVVYLNPADEDRLDDGLLGEGNWTRVNIY